MTSDAPPRSAAPSERKPTSRGPRIAVAVGIAAVVAAVAVIIQGTQEPRPTEQAAVAPPPAPATGPSRSAAPAAGPEEAREKAPRFSATTCWPDLARFNDAVTIDTFRAWAGPLIASNDPHVLAYLQERLSELIGGDEGRALEVLEWAREAPPEEFKLFLSGVRGASALLKPRVAERLIDLGLDPKMDLERRAGYLDGVQQLHRLESHQLERLGHFAKDAASGEAGWVATRAIGRVMMEDLARTGTAKPYLDKLLTIGTESQDEPVRYLALEMEMHADAPLDAKSTARLAKLLSTEGSEHVRRVVAHDLSLAEDKKQVLDIYAKAFAAERDLCVRWALFRFSARAAGKDALPTMANMAMIDPRFQGNYQDIERLYASGVVDYDRIWFGLPDQNAHGCLDHHDD